MSRLDYWLISNSISDNVCEVDIIQSFKTDHSAIKIEFKDVGDGVKDPGIWKLNCSLLRDEVYVNEINRMIPTWIYEGRTDLSGPRSVCDWVKCHSSHACTCERAWDLDSLSLFSFIGTKRIYINQNVVWCCLLSC